MTGAVAAKSPEAFRTISEVAEEVRVPAHVLRFWESRFTQIRPVKRAGGRRYYRPEDVELIAGIKRLLHDHGMTIRGVQKLLKDHGTAHVAALGGDGVEAPGLAPFAPPPALAGGPAPAEARGKAPPFAPPAPPPAPPSRFDALPPGGAPAFQAAPLARPPADAGVPNGAARGAAPARPGPSAAPPLAAPEARPAGAALRPAPPEAPRLSTHRPAPPESRHTAENSGAPRAAASQPDTLTHRAPDGAHPGAEPTRPAGLRLSAAGEAPVEAGPDIRATPARPRPGLATAEGPSLAAMLARRPAPAASAARLDRLRPLVARLAALRDRLAAEPGR